MTPVCRRTSQHHDDRLNEAALAAGFRDRDEGAVRDVVRRYGAAMTVIARTLVADRHKADDAVQQAFLQAWRAAHTVDVSRPLGPWLHTITRRVCIDMYRRDRRVAIPDSDAVLRAPTSSVSRRPPSCSISGGSFAGWSTSYRPRNESSSNSNTMTA